MPVVRKVIVIVVIPSRLEAISLLKIRLCVSAHCLADSGSAASISFLVVECVHAPEGLTKPTTWQWFDR